MEKPADFKEFLMDQALETKAGQLLNGVTGIIRRYEETWQRTGEKYNLFKVADIAHKEVIMCRVLADLLDPKGAHCRGSQYLKLFWETIAAKLPGRPALDIEHTKVTTEYGIGENRRIDITLEDGNVFVPIEVKIWAGDQSKQLADYFAFAKTKNRKTHVPVLYLTLDGHEPSESSKAGLGKGDYAPLSFKNDILAWLEACERSNTPETTNPVRENLRQLIAAVKSLCGKSEDAEMEDEIFKRITESEDSVRAAAAISKAQDNLDGKVLELFKGPILELFRDKLDAEYDSEYESEHWYPIYFEVKKGEYLLYINYDWSKAWLYTENRDNVSSKEGKALCEALVRLLGPNKGSSDDTVWQTEKAAYPDPAFAAVRADRLVYLYHLYKLYTEKPQEAADRIVSIARALEAVEGGK
jgi:hypothetical protein